MKPRRISAHLTVWSSRALEYKGPRGLQQSIWKTKYVFICVM